MYQQRRTLSLLTRVKGPQKHVDKGVVCQIECSSLHEDKPQEEQDLQHGSPAPPPTEGGSGLPAPPPTEGGSGLPTPPPTEEWSGFTPNRFSAGSDLTIAIHRLHQSDCRMRVNCKHNVYTLMHYAPPSPEERRPCGLCSCGACVLVRPPGRFVKGHSD